MKESSYVKDVVVKSKNRKKVYNQYIRYIEKHYNEIVEDVKIDGTIHGFSEPQKDRVVIHEIKRLRPTDTHFNNSLLGIQILSMSKRIMNEVMCLAYDIGCHIFYQDTDSMHIYKDDLTK